MINQYILKGSFANKLEEAARINKQVYSTNSDLEDDLQF